MSPYNSKPKPLTFNSVVASAPEEDAEPMKLLYSRGSSNYAQYNHDPDYGEGDPGKTMENVETAAQHYLKNYKKYGHKEPTLEAQGHFGISKNKKGKWSYTAGTQAPEGAEEAGHHFLGRVSTLGSYMKIEVDLKAHRNDPMRKKNMRVEDGFYEPSTEIGFHPQTLEPVRAGDYYAPGEKKPRLANPLELMNKSKIARDKIYTDLISAGERNIKPYWDKCKALTHFTHGRKVTDKDPLPEGHEKSEWHSLGEGGSPQRLQIHVDAVIHNMAEHAVAKDPEMQPLLDRGKTAKFVMCNCPHCATDKAIYGSNSIHDVQHHVRAAGSSDQLVRESFFKGFPVELNNADVGRVGELGAVGKRTHHRTFWTSQGAKQYINHLVDHKAEEQNNPTFTKPTVFAPMSGDVPSLDLDLLGEKMPFRHKTEEDD